jgi:excinuclease ABC subunit A
MRSHTAEMLAPVLKAGPRAERAVFSAAEAARKRAGDLDMRQVGRDTKMPWENDGRRWHTVDRIAHNGRPARWEGTAIANVVDAIEAVKGFRPANWNDRTVVEVTGENRPGAWFLHALTGDEWLLTLKFRVPRNTFDGEKLNRQLDLKTLDDLDEIPVYGRGERVRIRKLKGPWQEVAVTVHWLREIETLEFREFLKTACRAYLNETGRAELNPNDLTPWKVLGRKWHLSRKGFPSGKRVAWEPELLDKLFDVLLEAAPKARVDWGNKQVVYFRRAEGDDVWAAVNTKRRGGIDLSLLNEPGAVALGRIAEFGKEREITPARNGREAVHIRFVKASQVTSASLKQFLREHAAK